MEDEQHLHQVEDQKYRTHTFIHDRPQAVHDLPDTL